MDFFRKYFGPSTLVSAAFIGPGTVTVCTMAGFGFSYELIWALLFSILATLVLQEMAARLGWATQEGLGAAIRKAYPNGWRSVLFMGIVIGAIVVGNAAYEAGNLAGAALGIEAAMGPAHYYTIILAMIAFALLFFGDYHLLEKFLIGLVLLMSICFLITAILVWPSFGELLSGFNPQDIKGEKLLLVLGLVGTTVVPYNLFLHAAVISTKWKAQDALSDLRWENAIAIGLGGLVSICILITAAACYNTEGIEIANAKDLALALKPLLGNWATWAIAIGLFGAGLTSAITAPLAAAYAARGLFGWKKSWSEPKFRIVWIAVLLIGTLVSVIGLKPIAVIKFAQVTNALLLPLIAIFLWRMMNNKSIMGDYVNSLWHNIFSVLVIGITLLLAFKGLNAVFSFW